ncbi:MAG: hypothetical protein FJY85_06135 [Deltaproteobacteria bacterium]|nr:hypothetical protein [Deltaproteobacteria bacterium]
MDYQVRLNQTSSSNMGRLASRPGFAVMRLLMSGLLICSVVLLPGCASLGLGNALGLGRWKWIEKTAKDEKHYLLKDISLNAGASHIARESFDHYMHPVINLVFALRNEKNHYVAESRWIDPSGVEFRTIRTTHDIQAEGKKDIDRRSQTGSTTRVHSIGTQELYNQKPGLWKVELYIDGELARRLEFSIR